MLDLEKPPSIESVLQPIASSVVSLPFKPAFGLSNAHLQTVFSSSGPRKQLMKRRFAKFVKKQQSVLLEGGNGIRLQGYYNQATPGKSAKKIVVLIHGWEGSHESTYMLSLSGHLLENGVDVFRLNLRDHGDTHALNEEIFNSTMIEEVVNAVEDLQARYPYQYWYQVGFSLGGNFCMRLAALARQRQIELNAAIAFCPVVHAEQCNVALSEPRNKVYERYFVRKWKRSLYKKLESWPMYSYRDELANFKTLEHMNQGLIPKYTPYDELTHYFDAYAIDGDFMTSSICPCYLHFARDDMIIPVKGVNDLPNSPNLDITVTEHGGHCGFLTNWRGDSWQNTRTLDIVNAH